MLLLGASKPDPFTFASLLSKHPLKDRIHIA